MLGRQTALGDHESLKETDGIILRPWKSFKGIVVASFIFFYHVFEFKMIEAWPSHDIFYCMKLSVAAFTGTEHQM